MLAQNGTEIPTPSTEISWLMIKIKTMNSYNKTKKGLVTRIFSSQRSHSKRRKHPMPSYTKQELKEWLYSQSLFHELFDKWKRSGYDSMQIPSPDRLDDDKPYFLENLRLVTWSENRQKQADDFRSGKLRSANPQRSVISTHKQSGEKAVYHSIAEAERVTGVLQGNITACCSKKRKSSGGYLWSYAKQALSGAETNKED